MEGKLNGKVAVVTGGAAGIGRETAKELANRGALVAVLDLNVVAAQQLAVELPGDAIALHTDVRDRASLEAAIQGVVDHYGVIDVLIANAGIAGPTQPILTVDPGAFELVLQTNLLGVWRTIQIALPYVVDRSGYVLAVSSMAAALPAPAMAAYGISKAGIDVLGRALRIELATTGTDVGVAYLGLVETDLIRGLRDEPGLTELMKSFPGPMSRPVSARDAARAIVSGVERRSTHVYAPRWVQALLGLRGQLTVMDRVLHRVPAIADAIGGAR